VEDYGLARARFRGEFYSGVLWKYD
jgi:hypothetical protein